MYFIRLRLGSVFIFALSSIITIIFLFILSSDYEDIKLITYEYIKKSCTTVRQLR